MGRRRRQKIDGKMSQVVNECMWERVQEQLHAITEKKLDSTTDAWNHVFGAVHNCVAARGPLNASINVRENIYLRVRITK